MLAAGKTFALEAALLLFTADTALDLAAVLPLLLAADTALGLHAELALVLGGAEAAPGGLFGKIMVLACGKPSADGLCLLASGC